MQHLHEESGGSLPVPPEARRRKLMQTSLKLLDVMANNSEAIARNWAKDVSTNDKTPSYHDLH